MRRFAGLAALLGVALAGTWTEHVTRPAPLPSFASVREGFTPSEAYLLDRHAQLLQVERIDYTRRRLAWTPLAGVSPALPAAVLLAEDHRFFRHGGVDADAILGAGANAGEGHPLRGASTLSMQLAAMLDPALKPRQRRRSWPQKLMQMRAAWRLEAGWSKPQILEAYLNLAGFRGELQGVRATSEALFGKDPSGLTADEAWVMAALLRAPAAEPAMLAQHACALRRLAAPGAGCGAVEAIAVALAQRDALDDAGPGLAPQLARRLLRQPGERRVTTLDRAVQQLAAQALAGQLAGLADHAVRDGAAVVVDNRSGDVLAYVSGAGTRSRAALVDLVAAPRQAGSTLKPFLYGLALDRRYLTAASLLDDSPLHIETGGGLYVPQDYDHVFRGLVSVRTALAASLNVPAVRALILVGPDALVDALHGFGYDSIDEPGDYYGYSLALGSAEVTLLEQVDAYRALANAGRWSPLRLEPAAPPAAGRQVLSAAAAFVVSDILSDRASRAITFGFDSPLATRGWSAAKTGTSKFMRDNWCIGYSTDYTVGVWVGNADGDAMQDVSGVSGAAPAWMEIMTALQGPGGAAPPAPPAGLAARAVHFDGGLEADRSEWFLPGTELAVIASAPATALRPRLAAPVAGMVMALDPDIPADRQHVLFRSEPASARLFYELDGARLADARAPYFWSPRPGAHRLRLVDAGGVTRDETDFRVRDPR